MSFLDKTYTLDKDENFKEFVESLGIPDEKVQVLLTFKPSQTLRKEGDEYVLSSTNPGGNTKELKFSNGVEFDEEVSPGIVGKSIFTVEDNVVTQTTTFADGLSLTYKRVFSGDDLVVDITSTKWDGTARRYYKAV